MAKISLQQASAIVDGALEKAREMKLRPIAVAVVDAGGHLVAQKREDGPNFFRATVAPAKAWGAVAVGISTNLMEGMARERPHLIEAFSNLANGRIVPVAGGVTIIDGDGEIIGAVGVSGDVSENDQACAVHGIEKAGLKAGLPPAKA